jgi:hypothetical protein
MTTWDTQIKTLIDWTLQGANVWEATSRDLISQAMKEAQRIASERVQHLDEGGRPEPTRSQEAAESSGEGALFGADLSTIVEDPFFEQAINLRRHAEIGDPNSDVEPSRTILDETDASAIAGPTKIISEAAFSEPEQAKASASADLDIKMLSLNPDRAMVLRWVLRDLVSERKQWSQVNRVDVQTLVRVGFAEFHGEVPAVTKAGYTAIGR